MDVAIFITLFLAAAGMAMAMLGSTGVTNRWAWLAAAGVSGSLLSVFLAATVAAIATVVDPSAALLRAVGLGFVFGVAAGGLLLALEHAVRSLRGR
jgi:hypothetical protein